MPREDKPNANRPERALYSGEIVPRDEYIYLNIDASRGSARLSSTSAVAGDSSFQDYTGDIVSSRL